MDVDLQNDYFPQTADVSYKTMPNFDRMTAKLKEFNLAVPEEVRVADEELEKLHLLCQEGMVSKLLSEFSSESSKRRLTNHEEKQS